MDLRKLKKLIDLVEESGITELEVTDGEEKVRIAKHPGAAPRVSARRNGGASSAPPSAADDDSDDEHVVKAPTIGIFHRAATAEGAPFVEVGSAVAVGDTLALLESMQRLTEVKADADGTVREICADNGQPVEFGEVLFVIG